MKKHFMAGSVVHRGGNHREIRISLGYDENGKGEAELLLSLAGKSITERIGLGEY